MIEFLKQMLNPLVLMGISAGVTFVGTKYWHDKGIIKAAKDKAETEEKALMERIHELETRLAVVGQTVQPITNAFQAFLVNKLTHYHTPEADALLAKLDPFVLTDEEENRLYQLMVARTVEMHKEISPIERVCARALPLVIAMIRHDLNVNAAMAELTVIAVPMRDEAMEASTVELKMVVVDKDTSTVVKD